MITQMLRLALPLVLIVVCFVTVVSCDSLFYYPSDKVYDDPLRYEYSEFFVESQSGNKLHVLNFEAEDPKALILHFHGNARNVTVHYKSFGWAVAEGYDLLAWDYSGYGRSTGHPERKAIFKDALTMLEFGVEQKKKKGYKLIVIGQSLGGAVMLGALGHFDRIDEVDLIMADCTFHSYVEVAQYHINHSTPLKVPLGRILITDRLAPYKSYEHIKERPILVSHCRQDKVVPYPLGEALYQGLRNREKWFWELDCKHTAGYYQKENQLRVLAFWDSQLFAEKVQNEIEAPNEVRAR